MTATYRCMTCQRVGSLADIACGHPNRCRHFAAYRAAGLPPDLADCLCGRGDTATCPTHGADR